MSTSDPDWHAEPDKMARAEARRRATLRPVGALFVTPDGTTYRLTSYLTASDPPEHPQYLGWTRDFTATTTDTLPADARLVWAPNPEGTGA